MKSLPDNEKPREKAILLGVESLTNSELLAILLCTGSRKYDVLETVNLLLQDCKTLTNLSKYSMQEISKISGIKKAKALRLKAALELHFRIEKERQTTISKINSILDAAKYIKSFIYDFTRENFIVLLLNKLNKVISIKNMTNGVENMVSTSNNMILSYAVKNNACKIIIAHNHPSNKVEPSENDVYFTDKLNFVSAIIGIKLVDHLIITDEFYYSILEKQKFSFSK